MAQTRERLTGDPAVDERASGLTGGYVASILEESARVQDVSGWRSSHPMLDPRFIRATYGLNPWFACRGQADRALESSAYADRLPLEVRVRRDKAEFSQVFWPGDPEAAEWGPRLISGPLVNRGWVEPDRIATIVGGARRGQPYEALTFGRATAMDRWLRAIDG
jgi:hypothetical protein